MIKLRLPVPPSLNNLYPTVAKAGSSTGLATKGRISRDDYLAAMTGAKPKTRRIKSQAYKDWIKAADRMVLTQKENTRGKIVTGKWAVFIRMPSDTLDLDNRIKPILDFIVRLGLTPDDRHCRSIAISEETDVDNLGGECEVMICSYYHILDTTGAAWEL